MKLLNTYEDKNEAEIALTKITGKKRLASERDSTMIIYNLFGHATWGNFYKLGMFSLPELQTIVLARQQGSDFDYARYQEILKILTYVAKSFDIKIPSHWL
ncbi:hypothetical protein WKS02_000133 [Yersinia enterocolitica]